MSALKDEITRLERRIAKGKRRLKKDDSRKDEIKRLSRLDERLAELLVPRIGGKL